MVFTKEAQTADHYIERFAHENNNKYNIVVATSDGLQQIIVRGEGCLLLSARELKAEVEEANERVKREHQEMQGSSRNYLSDALSLESKQHMEEMMKKEK